MIMMLYKNMKVKVCLPGGDTGFIEIVAGILQGSNIDRSNERKWLYTKKRWYLTQTIMDADYTDDIALLANTPTQPESLLHSLKQAVSGISLHVNADKMEYVCLDQKGDISILNVDSLKLVDKSKYLGSSVSSTENDINMWLAKA